MKYNSHFPCYHCFFSFSMKEQNSYFRVIIALKKKRFQEDIQVESYTLDICSFTLCKGYLKLTYKVFRWCPFLDARLCLEIIFQFAQVCQLWLLEFKICSRGRYPGTDVFKPGPRTLKSLRDQQYNIYNCRYTTKLFLSLLFLRSKTKISLF